jgi:hypothetical protein
LSQEIQLNNSPLQIPLFLFHHQKHFILDSEFVIALFELDDSDFQLFEKDLKLLWRQLLTESNDKTKQ